MRRADRLFRIVEYLKARRQVVTAEQLAEELEVSTRTIYRDIADLGASGVHIMGEAGVGYSLSRDHTVRPLMFGLEELDALILGAAMVRNWGDKELGKAASQAIDKIKSILPDDVRREIDNTFLFSFASNYEVEISIDFTSLRRAIRSKNKLYFSYEDEKGSGTERLVRPLSLCFFGSVWLLLAWCEKRNDFRNFRLDRIVELNISEDKFKEESGKMLRDYCRINGYDMRSE